MVAQDRLTWDIQISFRLTKPWFATASVGVALLPRQRRQNSGDSILYLREKGDIVLFGGSVEFKGDSFHVTHSMTSERCLSPRGHKSIYHRLTTRQYSATRMPGLSACSAQAGSLVASCRSTGDNARTARHDSPLLSKQGSIPAGEQPVRAMVWDQRCNLPAGRQAGSADPAEVISA